MSAAEKILKKMQASKIGWGARDFNRLYLGFGFLRKEGGCHTLYIHPEFPILRATVARHSELPSGYAQHAIKCIGELNRLRNQK